ncbi:hypothetical protein QR680_015546 [Steinernema hermaphroditum]|uniref:G-protein coupled receptors family 1 profile domain-containing protein n=1 Tax=Steinernema hermaphroditum TaxID=289476 RepID=A0AA39H8F4_9BILA|nr:hypothetical protein QR680_015546 [Steinernema hermaphroditum]
MEEPTPVADQLRAAFLIVMFGFTGIIINGYVLYAVCCYKVFGKSFGVICASQILANLGNSVVFGILVGPITIIDSDFHATYLGKRTGQMLIMFWNASMLSHLVTSVNRCVNVYFPLRYESIFSLKFTYILITLVWVISFLQGIPYVLPQCALQYHPEEFTFLFAPTSCLKYVWYYADFWMSITVVSIIGIVDFCTFFRIHRLQKSTILQTKSKDIKFFFQALVQGIATATELIVYFWISPFLASNKWAHFCATTLAWISEECCDGHTMQQNNEAAGTVKVTDDVKTVEDRNPTLALDMKRQIQEVCYNFEKKSLDLL